jgi:ribose 5-phosphate isomerase B
MKKVYLGADHAGFKLKEYLKKHLLKKGYQVVDLGNSKLVKTDDYPDFAKKVGQAVAKDSSARGILTCHNGVGICIAANKVKGVRAALVDKVRVAREAVNDANANVICFGQADIKPLEAAKATEAFLKTKFSPATRHQRRFKKLTKIESANK